jgi:hypothetical protein
VSGLPRTGAGNGAWRPNFNGLCIRKWYGIVDETLTTETGEGADGEPLVRVVVAAALRNPYAGRFERDLSAAVSESVELGREFGRRLTVALGNRRAASYGKACIVGTSGEYEHGNAFLTTEFADPIRDALGGALAWIPSTGKAGGPQTTIDVPLAHKDALYVRSHYDTVSVGFSDAPQPDEIAIIFACATRGRLHARLGGLTPSQIKVGDGLR